MLSDIGYELRTAPAPGAILLDELNARRIKVARFADRIGLSPPELLALIRGEVALSHWMARGLQRELGIGLEFWLRLEIRYRAWRPAVPRDRFRGVGRIPSDI